MSLPDEEETIKNETFEGQGKMPLWNLRLHEPDVVGLSWTEYEVGAPSNPFRLGVHIKFCLGVLIKMPTSVPLNIKQDRLVTQVVTFGAPTRCATPSQARGRRRRRRWKSNSDTLSGPSIWSLTSYFGEKKKMRHPFRLHF